MAEGGDLKLAFVIILCLITGFVIACFGVFIWRMVGVADECKSYQTFNGHSGPKCPKPARIKVALWVLCLVFVALAMFIGWVWVCCGGGFCVGLLFTVMSGIAMVFFITLLAIPGFYNNGTPELAIGIVGMILTLAMLILGIIGMIIGTDVY